MREQMGAKMRLLLTGDWHITDKKPSRRLDKDYFATIMSKLDQVGEIAQKECCSYVLQAGDFFDSPNTSLSIIIAIDKFISKRFDGIKLITIYGQHDTHFHSKDIGNTPLNIFNHFGKINVGSYLHENTFIKCVSWFDEMPEPAERVCEKQILVLHKTISNGYTAFESTDAKTLLGRLDYDLILSGDNHKQFTVSSNGKHLVNPGSLMRSSIDQAEHEPAVYIYDTVATRIKDVIRRIPLTVNPTSEVFDLDKFEEEKELNGKIILFADEIASSLGETGKGNLDFIENLKTYIASLPLDHMIKDMLKRATGGRI
jgi:DNA repair exonuclease SbcCD nuclease subunit